MSNYYFRYLKLKKNSNHTDKVGRERERGKLIEKNWEEKKWKGGNGSCHC